MDHRLRHIHAKQTSSDLLGWQIALSSQTWVQTATHSSHQNFNWRLWTLLFNTVPQTTCSKLPKAPWIISDPYDRGWEPPVQHPWWFWLFISNAVLSPFMYIILPKLKQPALQKICHGIKWFGASTSWSWKGWGRPAVLLQLLLMSSTSQLYERWSTEKGKELQKTQTQDLFQVTFVGFQWIINSIGSTEITSKDFAESKRSWDSLSFSLPMIPCSKHEAFGKVRGNFGPEVSMWWLYHLF